MVPEYRRAATLLRIEHVTMRYGARVILRDLSAQIDDLVRPGMQQGQIVALLAPSGTGKSQLLRIIAGLQQPTEGRVLVTAEGVPVHRGMVGMVAQDYPLFDHRSVLGNLMVAARQHGAGRREAREQSMAALERFGLADHAGMWPRQLSGGQRQRVAIAQQFMCSEHLLLMDEPFSGLDPNAVDGVCGMLREVAADDELNTIVIVTHAIDAALQVADTLWLMGREPGQPGARIIETIDLIARGVAWQDGARRLDRLIEAAREVRERFRRL